MPCPRVVLPTPRPSAAGVAPSAHSLRTMKHDVKTTPRCARTIQKRSAHASLRVVKNFLHREILFLFLLCYKQSGGDVFEISLQ
jgi:hypothetical protein